MRELAALGLEVHPLIAGPPNLQGQAALMRNPKKYIDAAVAEAVRNNYSGYNFDNELRGKFTEGSWAFLRGAKHAPFEPFLFKKRRFSAKREIFWSKYKIFSKQVFNNFLGIFLEKIQFETVQSMAKFT